MVEERARNVKAEPEDMRSVVEKLTAWSDHLSPSEQVMLGLLLKRLAENEPVDTAPDPPIDFPPRE